MKNFICIIVILFNLSSVALAVEWQGLTALEKENVRLRAREMNSFGIPEAESQEMLTQMVKNRFEEQSMIRASRVVMDAARSGLPTEPLMSKAMEGMVKKVHEQKIIAAMETVRNRYALADQMARSLSMDKSSIEAVSNTIVDSLTAGMQIADIEAVMAQLKNQTQGHIGNSAEVNELRVQTMQTMRTMARLRVNSEKIAETLNRALRNSYTHQEMHQLRQQITNSSNKESPMEIANRYAESLGKSDDSGNSHGAGLDGKASENSGASGNSPSNSDSESSAPQGGNSGGGRSSDNNNAGGNGSGDSGSDNNGAEGNKSGSSKTDNSNTEANGSGNSGSDSGGRGGSNSDDSGSGGKGSGGAK